MTEAVLHSAQQLGRVQQAMAERGFDALLITPGADLRYLCGYDAMPLERLTCLVLPREGPGTLIVPRLERPAAESSPATGLGLRLVDYLDGQDAYALVSEALRDAAPAVVGVANRMWAEHVLRLAEVLPARQRLASEVLTPLRERKTPAEIDALRRAGRAIDDVHRRMAEWLRPGRTELAVAADVAAAIRDVGHRTVDFTIVGSGPNGASPHHDVSERVLEAGDVVVVDIGGTMPDGYRSDCTRTYVLGDTAPPEFAAGYAVLRDAHQAGIDAVRPGVTGEQVDAAGRDLLTAAGYGELFLHRTGHGIGLDGHEDPYIVTGNDAPLEAGMAFSIEPGVYWAGRYGARIEDIVICTDDGVERLNTLPTDLVFLR